jgi:pilus assembly protein Flp/PilA
MRGLVPRIHVFTLGQDVDGRDKPGHDEKIESTSPGSAPDAFALSRCGQGRFRIGTKGVIAMRTLISEFFEDETAATAIEYGLIAAGISVAIIVAVQGLAVALRATFFNVSTALR